MKKLDLSFIVTDSI